MAKLTAGEERLLRHPPTPTTWVCGARATWNESGRCKSVNSGSKVTCWMCRARRPAKPTLLWPLYVAVCEKANHEPGKRYRPVPIEPQARPTPRRKKGA